MLKIYNTLARDKQEFVPLVPGRVGMYVCGMTVYDYCHLGHARVMVVFDMVRRWLRAEGLQVTYVRNITDIDDKIIKRAAENGEPIATLTERFIAAMDEDAAKLGVEKPDHEPRATQYVPGMVAMIGALDGQGAGLPARRRRRELCGAQFSRLRKAVRQVAGRSARRRAGRGGRGKDDPLDFVLWKSARARRAQLGFALGPGRPGWHIECSVMGSTLLGSISTSTAAAPIFSFRTTKTRSPRAKACTGITTSITGYTTASSVWTTRRCPSRWATFSRYAKC